MSVARVGVAAPVLGFGYEGLTQADLVRRVVDSGVSVLVDVRLNPISRKRGLSKTALGAALNAVGVRYLHMRGLGNPKWNRAGFATLDVAARDNYRALLAEGDGLRDLHALRRLCAVERVGLLCFEAESQHCHRQVIVSAL